MRREILSDVDTDNEDQSSDSGDNNEESEEDTILSNEDGEDESEDESAEEDDDEPDLGDAESEDESVGNTGWADAMAKVLAIGKNSSKPVSVLSKAKKGNAKKRKADDGDASSSDEEPETKKKLEPLAVRKARKKEIDSIGRRMPNVLERNAEKALARIATRGVVQLFNAVRDHQKDVKFKLKEAGGSFRKQEKVYKNLDKESFIQMLGGKSVAKPEIGQTQKSKSDLGSEETQSSWSILREDYMLGAKMKDWDKESDEEA